MNQAMMVQPRPWKPWEYQVLNEGHNPERTANLLSRNVEEVSRKIDLSFTDWYRRHRCPGSPKRATSIKQVAKRLYNEDGYWKYITEGELEALILQVIESCFRHFNPEKMRTEIVTRLGRQRSLSVQEKFVKYFRFCLQRKLNKTSEAAIRRWKKFPTLFCDEPEVDGAATEVGNVSEGRVWSRLLFRKALTRLPERARSYIQYRYLEDLTIPEIAERFGVKPRTVYNNYSFRKIVSIVKSEVSKMILQLPSENLEKIVHYLHFNAEFNPKAIAELLCIPRKDVDSLLDGAIDRIMANMARDRRREDVIALIDT